MLTALSLAIPYFLGLGMLITVAVPGLLDEAVRLPRRERGALPALFLAAGILIDYLLVLAIGNLHAASAVGALLAVAGAGCVILKLRGKVLQLLALGRVAWVLIPYLALLYGIPIFLDPLAAGDARSIWFFHGKMIYYSGGLTSATGLATAPVAFSHVDYPKLVGVIAAQFAMVAGYWNEFLPKGSLAVLLLPPLLGVVSFFRGVRISAVYLVSVLFFGAGWTLWNGYMDGYLALYAAVSLLFWGRWLTSGSAIDLCGGVLMLGMVMNLKNEGVLFALALATALLGSLFFRNLSGGDRGSGTGDRDWESGKRKAGTVENAGYGLPLAGLYRSLVPGPRFLVAPLLPLLCVAVWAVKKSAWGLENDLRLGAGSLPIIVTHLRDGGAAMIGNTLIVNALVGKAAIIAAGAAAAAAAFRVRIPAGFWLAVVTGFIYFTGMFCVYLATPADLQWHLSTSADRTMMTVLAALFAGTYLVLREMEPGLGTGKGGGESGRSANLIKF